MRIEKSVRAPVSPGALALAISVLATGAPEVLPDDGGLLALAIRSPNERASDYDALAAEWLRALPGAADGFEAEIIPRRLPQILPYVRDPLALIPLLEKASEANYSHGSVRQGILGILSDLYQSAGKEEERLKVDASRGFIREWLVIGPFGKGAGSPFSASFPPEDEQRIDRTYQDGWQRLSWRKAIRGPGEKFVQPWRHAYPATGVAYFLSQVECKEELDALLLRSSQDTLQVWLNGRLLANDDAGASFLESVRASPIRLCAGWNRILVKTRGPFAVQLGDPAGLPLRSGAPREEEALEIHAVPDQAWRDPAEPRPGAVEAWTRRVAELAEKSPGSEETARLADTRMGLALVHQARGRDDLAVTEAEKALALRPDDAALLYHAGGIFGSARYLPSSISKNRSKAAFESAIAKDPAFLPAYERSARHLEEDEQYVKAAARMREGLERSGLPNDPSPNFFRGLLRLQSIFSRKKWLAEEIEVVKGIEKIAPSSPVPARFWGRHYESLGNLPEASRHLRKAFDLDRDQIQLLHSIHGMAIEMGKVDEAEAALREAVRLAPDEPRQGDALVEFLAGQGRYDEALEIAHRAAERNPDDSRGARRIAEILDRARKGAGANDGYRKALALDPGDLELKRYVAYRSKEPEAAGGAGSGLLDAFWTPYDAKLEEWTATIPENGPLLEKVSAILVLDITVIRFEVDGSSSEYVHQAFKLLSEESKEDLANVRTPGEVVTLRTLSASGETLQPVPGEGKRSYVMPGLTPGAIIEFAYRTDATRRSARGLRVPPFFFQDTDFRHSVILSRYVVILPKGLEPGFIETRLAEGSTAGVKLARVEKTVRELDDGRTVVMYEARNVPRLERENMLPSPEEIFPNVILLEKQTWADVAGMLRNRFWGATRPTPELREAALKVTAGIDAPIERAKAIYRYVNDLVAKQGGTSQAVQVLLEKSGDRTTLFKALCDLSGVPTHWAFLRPNEDVLPRAHWSYPRPEMFSFPFVAVEEEGKAPVYVSLSARGTPFGRLPESIEGGKAMVLLQDGERIDSLPPARLEDSATSIRGTLRLGADADAEAQIELSSGAVAFYAMKDQLKTFPAFQKDVALRQMATQFFPGARVKKAEMRGLDDPDAPPAFVLDLIAPKLLKASGDKLLLKSVFQPSQMVRFFGGRSVRELPLHLTRARVSRDEVRVESGDSCDLERAPKDVLLASALGEFSLTYRDAGRAVVVERRLTLRPGRLEPGEYEGFLEFCRKVDAAEEENIVFRKRSAKP